MEILIAMTYYRQAGTVTLLHCNGLWECFYCMGLYKTHEQKCQEKTNFSYHTTKNKDPTPAPHIVSEGRMGVGP